MRSIQVQRYGFISNKKPINANYCLYTSIFAFIRPFLRVAIAICVCSVVSFCEDILAGR